MPFRSEKMVELVVLNDSVEVSALAALLEERGIRYLMEAIGSTPYGGIFELQKGQARLKVFKSDAEEARILVDDFFETPAVDDSDTEEKETVE